MFKHQSRNEGILYEAPNTRSKVNNEVREELAGTETFLTDTQGLRLAYESPNRMYRNGSILYIAGTKDPKRKKRQRLKHLSKYWYIWVLNPLNLVLLKI